MKINPVGIQSYQQIPRREEPSITPGLREQDTTPVTIEPKDTALGSSVSIKAKSGNYGESLTAEERRALELVFARFKDSGRFGGNGRAEADKSDHGLGQIIDVKV